MEVCDGVIELRRRWRTGGLRRIGLGNVYALNASTGTTAVELHDRRIVYSSPAVANGVVYVGSDDDNVYALNASTGALLWNTRRGLMSKSSPAVANGVVYVGSNDASLYALGASTGALLWTYPAGFSSIPHRRWLTA